MCRLPSVLAQFGSGRAVGLEEPVDDAGKQHVRVGDHALAVERPGVEAERATGEQVLANEYPGGAEATFGQERVRASNHGGGGTVRLGTEPQIAAQRSAAWFTGRGQGAGPMPLGPFGLP